MSARYLFRLDDITPRMNWKRFWSLLGIFERRGVRPLLAVIPENADASLDVGPARADFWEIIRGLTDSGAVDVAQHGFRHVLRHRPGAGIIGARFGVSEYTEFAGDPYEQQLERISAGRAIMRLNGIETSYWVAPAHSFDANTLRALRDCGFTAISDGISLLPFVEEGLLFVPQQFWRPRWMPAGTITVCLHPNETRDREMDALAHFLDRPRTITSFSAEVSRASNELSGAWLNRSFRGLYVGARRLKNIVRPARGDRRHGELVQLAVKQTANPTEAGV